MGKCQEGSETFFMEKKKINMFPSPEDMEEEEAWGEFFRNQFREDSKRWESEMERRKEIRNIDASPELFDRIVEQLKKEGKWEEDDAEEKAPEKETPDLRSMLSEEDWEALQLGRKVQAQGRRRYVKRFVQMAATVLICVFAVSMSSEANRQYIMGMVNTIIGNGSQSAAVDTKGTVFNRDKEEGEAYEEIEEKLGIPVPRLTCLAEGMAYDSYFLSEGLRDGSVFYTYGEMIVTLGIHKREGGSVMNQTFGGELVNKSKIEVNGLPVQIYEMEHEGGEHSYIAEFEWEDGYYVLTGKMEREAFLKVVQGIAF